MTTALLILWIAGMPLAWGLVIRHFGEAREAAVIATAWPVFLLGVLVAGLMGAFGEAPDEEEF
jgi:hypothetical protein